MSRTANAALLFSILAAAASGAAVGWLVALPFGWLALWVVGVERAVGLARLVRFDPWRHSRTAARAAAYGLVTLASVVIAGIFGVAVVRSASPVPGLVALLALATGYSAWAVAFVKRHDEDGLPSNV